MKNKINYHFIDVLLDAKKDVVWDQHKVFDRRVMPTDGFIEMIYGAVIQLFSVEKCTIENFEIEQPLVESEEVTELLRIGFMVSNNSANFEIISIDDADHKRFVSGRVNFSDPKKILKLQKMEKLETKLTRKKLKESKTCIEVGPYFDSLEEVDFYKNGTESVIKLCEIGKKNRENYFIHPSIISGMLATAMIWAGTNDIIAYLPIHIDEIIVKNRLKSFNYKCNVYLKNSLDGLKLFDLLLFDESTNKGCVFLKNLILRRTEAQQLAKMIKKNNISRRPHKIKKEAIAVIGMSGKFPGAKNVEEFWQNLYQDRLSTIEIPEGYWERQKIFEYNDKAEGKKAYRWGGFIAGADEFDASFFNISPREADLMDPQQRLFLQTAWHALEDAGAFERRDKEKKCGVFVGASVSDYIDLIQQEADELDGRVLVGNTCSILASRISYYLNLTGPCIALDTACSSSLAALHLACESIKRGESNLALAGGVIIYHTSKTHQMFEELGILSKKGKTKTFDDSADGWVLSEGVGAIVLKSLERAVEEGDHIYGVIDSSGMNQSGETMGLTAPKSSQIGKLAKEVYKKSNIKELDYIEVQGTASKWGDAIEVAGLKEAYQGQKCALGTFKPLIGHPTMAFGAAAVMKVLLCMKHEMILPTKVKTLNPDLYLEGSSFYIPQEIQEWKRKEERLRRAAINSFGISGTNVHVVIEEAPKIEKSEFKGSCVFVLSAKDKERLAVYIDRFIRYLEGDAAALVDIAYTMQVGRQTFEERIAVVVISNEDLLNKLKEYQSGNREIRGAFEGAAKGKEAKSISLLLSGKPGKHYVEEVTQSKSLDQLAQLWVDGATIDWKLLYGAYRPRKVSLPTYPFAPEKHWVHIKTQPKDTEKAPEKKEALDTTEHEIIKMLSELLGEKIKESDFDLDWEEYGANSLVVMQLLSRMQSRLGLDIPRLELLQMRTLRDLINYVQQMSPGEETLILKEEPLEAKNESYPLSEGQKGLWIYQQLDPESYAYNVPLCLEKEDVDIRLLKESVDRLVSRYPFFKTKIERVEGELQQRINEKAELYLKTEDNAMDGPAFIHHLQELSKQSFDVEQGPLMRVYLFTRPNGKTVILFLFHHIIVDGSSIGIIYQEFQEIYSCLERGETPSKQVKALPYKDFVLWQQELLEGKKGEELKSYWEERLKGADEPLELPTDMPRLKKPSHHGKMLLRLFDRGQTEGLKKWARQQKVSDFSVYLSLFVMLLFRYTGKEDINVGVPLAVRPQEGFEKTIGYFINMVVMRNQVEGTYSFKELVKSVYDSSLEAIAYGEYPFTSVVRDLHYHRKDETSPLFQVSFVYQNWIKQFLGEKMSWKIKEELQQLDEYELSLEVIEEETDMGLCLKYEANLFEEATIQRILTHFQQLIVSVLKDPEQGIGQLDILSNEERNKLLLEFNATEAAYPKDKTFHELFEEQAEKSSDRVALEFDDQKLTYQELNKRANQLARQLIKEGVKPDDRIGIMVERSLEMMVGILGILKSGAAYVPLDPDFPKDRLQFMLEDSQAKVLLIHKKFKESLNYQGKVIELDNKSLYKGAFENVSAISKPENLAYVIYTSGSTGKPKGVLIEHRQLNNFLLSMSKNPGLEQGCRCLALTTLSFDIAGLELLGPLLQGGISIIVNQEEAKDAELLIRRIEISQPSIIQATPATWKMLIDAGWKGDPKLKVLSGGEALSKELATELLTRSGELWNMFGPTETTVWSTIKRIKDERERITIGKPIANTQVYIIDQTTKLLKPTGVIGELCIGGNGVGRGYLNRPKLTGEKFIDNPFRSGERIYRTGDLARWLPDGNIEFLGRIDHQVKIRGFRIECGEIETQLIEDPAVKQAVVIAREDEPGEKKLVGYVTGEEQKKIDIGAVRNRLKTSLPDYMIPSLIVQLDTISLTPNGKVDRKALPIPEVERASLGKKFVAPRTDIEKGLVRIWQELLKVEKLGIRDNFFEWGGDSLLAVRLATEVQKKICGEVTLQELLKSSTIEEMGQLINAVLSGEKLKEQWINLEEEAVLDEAIAAPKGPASIILPPKQVFITGGTGFVGCYLLKELLEKTEAKIWCLTRADSRENAVEKIRKNLTKYQLWDERYLSRIEPVLGDITQPYLGIEESQFDQLSQCVDAIYHNAAMVNHLFPYQQLKQGNVGSAVEILKLACKGRIKPVHYSSTISVFSTSDQVDEESAIDLEKHNFSDGYTGSKWVAEKMVSLARERNIPCSIYRLGLVTGNSKTGVMPLDQWFPQLIKTVLILGCYFKELDILSTYMAPVDFLGNSLVEISLNQKNLNQTFHLFSTEKYSVKNALQNSSYKNLEEVSISEWIQRARKYMDEHQCELPIYPFIANFLYLEGAILQKAAEDFLEDTSRGFSTEFSSKKTAAVLKELNISRPKVGQQLFEIYFSRLKENGNNDGNSRL